MPTWLTFHLICCAYMFLDLYSECIFEFLPPLWVVFPWLVPFIYFFSGALMNFLFPGHTFGLPAPYGISKVFMARVCFSVVGLFHLGACFFFRSFGCLLVQLFSLKKKTCSVVWTTFVLKKHLDPFSSHYNGFFFVLGMYNGLLDSKLLPPIPKS